MDITSPTSGKTGGKERREGQARNAQFRPFLQTDLLLLQQLSDGWMIAQSCDIVTSYLEPAGDVGNEVIGVDIVWSVSRAPGLAFPLVPSRNDLSCDLPPATDVNAVFPTTGDLEAAAQPVGEDLLNDDECSKSET